VSDPGPGARPRWHAPLLGLVILCGAGWLLLRAERPPIPIQTGLPAPALRLPALDGQIHSLAELRGRVVLVNFWATWCKPCEDEMPAMERLYQALAPSGFELLAVSVDEDPDLVSAFRERLGLSFPILLDPEKVVARVYQSFRFPESYLIDQQGVLIARYIGPRDWDAEAYEDRIRRLIGGDGPGGESGDAVGERDPTPEAPVPQQSGPGAS
jgi:thiol-disulfide isomerase/thioredoxin